MLNLGYKARVGLKWSTLKTSLSLIINTTVWILLAFFLDPVEFGQIAIINFIIGLGEMLANFGLSQAIIQRAKTTHRELSSIFWFTLFAGILLTTLLIGAAPFIANYYEDSGIRKLIQITAFSFILSKPPLIFVALLQKEIEFKTISKYVVAKIILAGSVTLSLAYLGFGVMGVILGNLAGLLLYNILFFTWAFNNKKWMPGFHFQFKETKPFLRFGIFVTGKSLINYLGANFDILIIGSLLGVDKLGYYHFAKRLIEAPRGKISQVFRSITYPVYSKLINGNQKDAFLAVYLKMTKVIAVIGFFVFGAIFVSSINGIPAVFGEKWMEAVFVTQIISFVAIIAILSDGFASSALYAHNKPRSVLYVELAITPIRMLIVYITALHSIELVALGVGLIVVSKSITLQILLNNTSGLKMSNYFAAIKNPFLCFVFGTLSILPIISASGFSSSYSFAIFAVLTYIFVFTAGHYFVERTIFSFIKTEVQKIFQANQS